MTVAVIVGGASGIGRSLGEDLVAGGWRVAVIDQQSAPPRDSGASGNAKYVRVDASSPSDFDCAVDEIGDDWGEPTVWVCTTGRPGPGDIRSMDFRDWRCIFSANVDVLFNVIKRATRPGELKGTSILSVSSGAGLLPRADDPAYSASKAASIALIKAVAVRHATDGLFAVTLCPGPVDTPMLHTAIETSPAPALALADIIAACPARRLADPREIAAVASWLLRERPIVLSGSAIPLDFGKSQALQKCTGT